MNVLIKNKGRGYWTLEVESDNHELNNRVLASISSYMDNQRYSIVDFRYSLAKKPYTGDGYSNHYSINVSDKLKDNFDSIFFEPKSFYENGSFATDVIDGVEYYSWHSCDGIVFAGADYPYREQNLILKNPSHIFSYKKAKEYLQEAKKFWQYFNGSFDESKIENIYRLPSDFEIKRRLDLI
jgi:hypothetical protein